MKIAVYTITKNEAQFIKRWADSCAEADYRLIVDTGSTDDTVGEAIDAGCNVDFITVSPWRFDDARNASLALLPEDIDLCISLDADEVLAPGWREALESLPPGITRPRYKYVWSWNADGSEGVVYHGDKIHSRKNYRWVHPVHEVLACTAQETQWVCHGLEIHHHPDHTKSRAQYLPLLELAVKEKPDDDRNQFYLGREYMFVGRKEDAERHLKRALDLSTWRPERANAMRFLSRVTGERESWLLRACAEAPDRREPWVELARFYYEQKNWSGCLACCQKALALTVKPLEYLCEGDAWGSLPHDLASIACWNLGLGEKSLEYAETAWKLEPSNQRLWGNYSLLCDLVGIGASVDVIIPTKSNTDALIQLLGTLERSRSVGEVHVVADGEQSFARLSAISLGSKTRLHQVPLSAGIHAMWNLGIENCRSSHHLLLLNDDVVIDEQSISRMAQHLNLDESIGLICPNYDKRQIIGSFEETRTTCRGRYDGTGGMAGFAMMLRKEIKGFWRFDERMKWWYGDDDLVRWVTEIRGLKAVISSSAFCDNNSSWTVNNDPPKDFSSTVENDRKVFLLKWGEDA